MTRAHVLEDRSREALDQIDDELSNHVHWYALEKLRHFVSQASYFHNKIEWSRLSASQVHQELSHLRNDFYEVSDVFDRQPLSKRARRDLSQVEDALQDLQHSCTES